MNDGEIQSDDEANAFASDDAAVAFVREKAAEGSPAHIAALEVHRQATRTRHLLSLEWALEAKFGALPQGLVAQMLESVVSQCAEVQRSRSIERHGFDKYDDGDALMEHFGLR